MANYVGQARSNYFHVKDQDAFRKALSDVSITVEVHDNDPTLLCLLDDSDDGWPSSYVDADGECHEFDVVELVQAHLVEGEVAILLEIGAEKLRYLIGHAVAIHSDGRLLTVDLNDIYGKAESAFGVKPTLAEY